MDLGEIEAIVVECRHQHITLALLTTNGGLATICTEAKIPTGGVVIPKKIIQAQVARKEAKK